MKIMLIGDQNVGKTLLIRHLIKQHYTKPTIGFQVVHTENFEIYDTSGDKKFQTIISRYYHKIKHFVLVYKDLKTVYKYQSLRKYGIHWTLIHNSDHVDKGEEYAVAHSMNFIRSNLSFQQNAKEVLKKGCPFNFNTLEKNNSINSIYNGIAFTVDMLDDNPEKVRLFALRSFGESLYHSITDASLEFGFKAL